MNCALLVSGAGQTIAVIGLFSLADNCLCCRTLSLVVKIRHRAASVKSTAVWMLSAAQCDGFTVFLCADFSAAVKREKIAPCVTLYCEVWAKHRN